MTAVKRYFKAGAVAYLLQGTPSESLCQAVGCVREGSTFIDPTLSAAWLGRQRGDYPQGTTEALTKRERQVLELIVQEHTTDEIAGQLFVNRCTVETHRSHILQKLGVRNTAGIVREALRRELVG
ncbi:response regulator transcription factor [Lewinella lacunae]|uniref:Response regulator transcription factor n=2 Tax=Neolewinella lacunae TaxID=1517758 RepID=A0A923PFR4_9BACT|nr:response regulator transcription factor [Neolewinella lacunae]